MDTITRSEARFRVAVHRSLGCYVARVANLPGCICRGSTQAEAVENARAAIRAYLALAPILATEAIIVELEISA
jgi:predicted RNase H-like HicB family nuclease